MTVYEYKVVPAPAKGKKAKGVKTAEDRFAFALQEVMNSLAADGWEFQRTETLPSLERSGLTSTTTQFRNVMVFRRPRADDISGFDPQVLEQPDIARLPAPDDDAQGTRIDGDTADKGNFTPPPPAPNDASDGKAEQDADAPADAAKALKDNAKTLTAPGDGPKA